MDHIQALLDLSKYYWSLAMIVGLLSCFIESFLPILPLVAIVGANAMIFGLWGGFIISWIGSGLGTLALFLLIRKYNDNKLFKKIKNKRVEKAILWMNSAKPMARVIIDKDLNYYLWHILVHLFQVF